MLSTSVKVASPSGIAAALSPPTTVESDANAVDVSILSIVGKRRKQVEVMAEDAGGEAGGDGGTERGEVRKEAGERNGRTKDSEEARGATDEATRNHDGKSIQGRAGKAGGGDRPARSGTRPAGRSTRSGSRRGGDSVTSSNSSIRWMDLLPTILRHRPGAGQLDRVP